MILFLLVILAFASVAGAGEQDHSYLSKDITIEFDGKNKVIDYNYRVIVRDDFAEDEFRYFYIFLPYNGKVKDVDVRLVREGEDYRQYTLKKAEKSIYHADYTLASDYYYYFWDLGSLKSGDVIKQQYRIELKDASYGDFVPILGSLPVDDARVRIIYPENDWALKYCVSNGEIELEKIRHEMEFHWENLPRLKDSDFKKAPRDMLPGIWYQFVSAGGKKDFSDWNDVYNWQTDMCKSTSLSEENSDLLQIADTPAEIFSSIINECRYVAVEIDKGRYKPMQAEDVWNQGYGDCKGLANLFVSWLNLAGYRAWPVLVRSQDSYLGNSEFPSPFVFDHEIAAFIGDNGDTSYQDLTAESVRFGDLPISLYGDFALPLVENTTPLRLPCNRSEPDTMKIVISGVIDESFKLTGHLSVRQTGQRAIREIWVAQNIQKRTDRISAITADFESIFKGATIQNIEEIFPDDSVIIQSAEIRRRNFGFRNDSLLILRPWFMSFFDYDIDPDIDRTWPTILRRNVIFKVEYSCKLAGIDLGDNAENDNTVRNDGFEFLYTPASHDDSLIVKAALCLKPAILDPADYRDYARDRQNVAEVLSQGLIHHVEQ